jgi:hypothetical protein
LVSFAVISAERCESFYPKIQSPGVFPAKLLGIEHVRNGLIRHCFLAFLFWFFSLFNGSVFRLYGGDEEGESSFRAALRERERERERERDGIVDRGKSSRRNELILLFVCVYVAVDWLFVPVLA